MTPHPAAYIRRSHVDPNSPGDISEAAQTAAVRKLAAADGHNGDLAIYSDWGISADVAKAARRTAYARLLADMEAGRVTAVYAFDVDRLYRDPRDLIRLQDAATRHRVTITTNGGRLAIGDGDDPTAEGFAWIGAVFGRIELLKSKKRNRASMASRRARGDALGKPPYGYRFGRADGGRVILEPEPSEPVAPVLDAYREAGTFAGAARLLNARGIPARHAPSWAGNVVRRVVLHAMPEVSREIRKPGRRARHTWTLAGLLRCECGTTLTARETMTRTKYGTFGPYIGYQCPDGRYDAAHPRPYMISEAAILPAIRAEVARHILPPAVAMGDAPDLGAERAELVASRERLALAFARGGLPEETYTTEDGALAERIAALADREERETIADVPPITAEEWGTWTPADLNAYLRATLRRVRLGADMRPLPFTPDDWRNPAARRP